MTPPTWLYWPAAAAAWAPTDLTGLQCWLDASDSSTITESGGSISLWEDKTTNGYDADDAVNSSNNKITTYRPTIVSAGQNGLDVINFASAQRFDHNSSRSMLKDRSHALVGIVFKWGSTSFSGTFMFIWSHGGTSTFRAMIGGTDTEYWRVASTRLDTDSNVSVTSGTAVDTNWHVIVASYEWTNGTFELFLDGTSIASGTYASSGNTDNTDLSTAHNARTVIGGLDRSSTAARLPNNSRMGELIVGAKASGSYAASDREKLEGYLAWKWGLEANLPNGHPYENAAP